MDQSVTFVDVETPNHRNDCISSIGIINVDSDGVVTSYYHLVDPETTFDSFNIKLTGITPAMVENEPTFEELWPEIEGYFINSLIVGHNAIFDLTVITSCLNRYHLPIPLLFYTCTYRIARALKIPSRSYKLNDLSSYYRVELNNHHNAMDDTKACMEIFYQLLNEPALQELNQYIKQFEVTKRYGNKDNKRTIDALRQLISRIGFDTPLNNLEIKELSTWIKKNGDNEVNSELKEVLKNEYIDHYQYLRILRQLDYLKSIKAKNIQALYELMAMLEEINIEINETMLKELNKWFELNKQFKNSYPFNQIFKKLDNIFNEKKVTKLMESELLFYIKFFFKPEIDNYEIDKIKDKVFCLSGNFSFGDKHELEKFIVLKQGIISNSITKKVDYLILGSKGSTGYKYGKYGAKVNKALTMQSCGGKIKLISEMRLMMALSK